MAEYTKAKYYYNRDLAILLANKIKNVFNDFDDEKFVKKISNSIDDLELKARVEVFSDVLFEFLPDKYNEAILILLQILGPALEKETGMFSEGFWLMPVARYVEKYGANDFDISINAIYEITKRHTGEYAVRPFLEKYPQQMLKVMKKWAKDKSFHVRRLACEGLRPRLPWAKKMEQFISDPSKIIPVLEILKEDESKFVQKSVANCINDILKDNYQVAIELIKKWSKSNNKNTQWIIKHSLRNEIKKNNLEAKKILNL